MFGDDFIIGCAHANIDEKGRFYIPKFCHPEKNDKIAIQKNITNSGKILILTGYHEYLKMLQKWQYLQNISKTEEEYLNCSKHIEDICSSIDSIVKLDSQCRLLIPKIISEELNFDANKQIIVKGIGHSAQVYLKK